MSRTRIKFCGMTRVEDALLAARLGVDAIGLVCVRRSPRFIALEHAVAIRAALPPYVTVVALFMDADTTWVREVEDALRPDLLQFHGSETDACCAAFATAHVKTLAMASAADPQDQIGAHPHAAGFLLDGHAAGAQGGSGQCFDWARAPQAGARPLIVAGGLHAGNVGEAIRIVQPWAVDVASGIESAHGIKDPAKMRAFVAAVADADGRRTPT